MTLELLGSSSEQAREVVGWVCALMEEENKEKAALYSALLQDLSEMVASLLVKAVPTLPVLPEHVKSTVDLIRIFKEIDSFTKTRKVSLMPASPPAEYQWERILEVSNIPAYFSPDTIIARLKDILRSSKGKILCPQLDVFLRHGRCYILVDGWDINELVEEDFIEKIEQELPEEREDEMDGSSAI